MRYMILKLHGNATPSSCDQRLFFSLGASLLLDASSPRTINIVKKKRSSGTQGFLCRTACWTMKAEALRSFLREHESKSKIFIDLEISEKTVKPMKAPENSTWSYLNEISPHFITNGYDIIYVSLFLTLLNEIPLKEGSSRCALYHSNAMDFFVSCVSLYSWFSAVSLIPQLTLWLVGKCVSGLKLRDLA